jgi:hypothetical protein
MAGSGSLSGGVNDGIRQARADCCGCQEGGGRWKGRQRETDLACASVCERMRGGERRRRCARRGGRTGEEVVCVAWWSGGEGRRT